MIKLLKYAFIISEVLSAIERLRDDGPVASTIKVGHRGQTYRVQLLISRD